MANPVPLSARQRALCEEALPIVTKAVKLLSRCTPHNKADLQSIGNEALVRCALRFDPSLGVPFGGYAWTRVRGAMLSAVYGHRLPRRVLALVSQPASGIDAEPADASPPTDSANTAATTLCVDRSPARAAALLLEMTREVEVDPLEDADWKTFVGVTMARLVGQLSAQDQTVVQAFYKENLTIDQAAAKLGVSRATVRRMHDRVKSRPRGGHLEQASRAAATATP